MADQLSVYQELESKVSEHGSMDKSEIANLQLQSCKNSQWAFAILRQDHFCSWMARTQRVHRTQTQTNFEFDRTQTNYV